MPRRSCARPDLPAAAGVAAAWLALVALLAPGAGTGAPAHPRLAAVDAFTLALGDGALDRLLAAGAPARGLVVVDGIEPTRSQVARLRAPGAVVLGYLSVGTIEAGRPWSRAARPFRLERWPQWAEWYADASRAGFRRLMTARAAPAVLARGFDGLFLDNVDMIGDHPRQAAGMRRLVRDLAARVHARGGVVMAQNGEDVIGPLLGVLDAWNREDVSTGYDPATRRYLHRPPGPAQAALRRIARAGLLVTATDYVAPGDGAGARRAVRVACAAGALPHVADIDLTRPAFASPPTCPAGPDA